MKKIIIVLTSLMLVFTLFGCQSKTTTNGAAKDYKTSLESVRDKDTNDAYGIMYRNEDGKLVFNADNDPENPMIEMTLQLLGLTDDQIEQCAISVSLMNVQAYSVVIVKPTSGNEAKVKEGIEKYRENIIASFQNYLPDQYEIANKSVVNELSSGEIVLVISENQEQLSKDIIDALK